MVEFASSEAGKKGGRARAKSMTKEQRSEIARVAAEVRWKKELPHAVNEGALNLVKSEIQCAVLENGTRVLTQSGMMVALGRARQAKGRQYYDADVNLPAFLTAKNLKPFITDDLRVTSSQIEFITLKGGRAFGYSADLLPKICDVFWNADEAGALLKSQKHIATQAKMLMRGLAHVGIIALVDEATGYQRDRARDELAKILEAFVAKEIQKWIKTFDLEFYELICELRDEPLERATKRPKYFGKLTNNLVYCRLAPGVLEQLKVMSPADEKGNRKTKLFQGLTPDIGHPKLREHLAGVTTAMKMAKVQGIKWEPFLELLDKTHPKYKPMPLFDDQE